MNQGDYDDEWLTFVETNWEIDELTQPNVLPVTALPDNDLFKFYAEVKEDLLERGEAIEQRTQEGRDLQSWRAALLIEIKRRDLR